jgi:hypothetical protein
VNVTLAAGNIDISTENDSTATRVNLRDIALHLPQELHFCREIFAAVGNVDRHKVQIPHLCSNDSGLVVESRVKKPGLLRESVPPEMEANSRIGPCAMPVTSIPL